MPHLPSKVTMVSRPRSVIHSAGNLEDALAASVRNGDVTPNTFIQRLDPQPLLGMIYLKLLPLLDSY